MPMVLKLQADAMNEDVSVANLLRTAKAIATKLDLEDALIWIDRELNGYEQLTTEDFPEYRRLTGEPKGWNHYHGWQPIHFENAETLKRCSSAPVGSSLGAIEEMLRDRSNTGYFVFPYQHDIKTRLLQAVDMPTDVHIQLGLGSIFNIVEAVRNVVLNWSLELEKAGILGVGMSFSVEEKTDAVPITQNFFAQNIGMVGNVTDQARVLNVQTVALDLDGVRNLLSQLQGAMTLLPDDARDALGPVADEMAQELASDQPDEDKLRGLLGSVRKVCEGATGNVLAQGTLALLMKLLGG